MSTLGHDEECNRHSTFWEKKEEEEEEEEEGEEEEEKLCQAKISPPPSKGDDPFNFLYPYRVSHTHGNRACFP